MIRRRAICSLLLMLTLCLVASASADDGKELRLAARNGDLAKVKQMLKAGVDANAAGPWGNTPLALAAGQGETEVVALLLKSGADPSSSESFFGMSVLDVALWKGEPDFVVAMQLLAAGAPDRATALETAFTSGNHTLAEAVAKAGPIYESEAKSLRRQYNGLDEKMTQIFDRVKTEADPPPPVLSAAQLAKFAGEFAGEIDGDEQGATVSVDGEQLVVTLKDEALKLAPYRDRSFRGGEPPLTLSYFGRAGTTEGISLEREGQPPIRMRPVEAPIVALADRPEFVEDPNRKPTIDWPGFRGKNRDGNGDGIDTVVEFDLESGKGVAWSVDLPGLGNSSPIVWGDRVYVTTAVAEGGSTPLRVGLTGSGDEVEEAVEHRWLLLAYDKASGNKVWEREVGRATPLTKRHFKATQANSSPVTDGEHIVVVFPTAGIACIGRDGEVHWKHELGGLNAGGFNDPGLQWGFAASPILYKGKVILQVDVHGDSYLAAWELASGKLLWKTPRNDVAPSWATPAIWSKPSGDELVVNASIIRGYNPQDGKPLWSLGPTSIQVVASPVFDGTTLFVSSGYPPARPIYAVKPGIRGDHSIESDDDAAPLLWYTERGGAYMPTPLFYRGLLYMVHHNARIVAHDARNGAKVYQARFSAGGTCTASPVVANGKIYQGTEEGTLYILEAGTEHNELAVYEFDEPLMATPAISEGLLLIRTPSKLIALKKMGEPSD